jgi:hypothetical protein
VAQSRAKCRKLEFPLLPERQGCGQWRNCPTGEMECRVNSVLRECIVPTTLIDLAEAEPRCLFQNWPCVQLASQFSASILALWQG